MHLNRNRLRFTVRSLMIVVAIVGLLLGASLWVLEMRTRSAAYRKRALEFGVMFWRGSGSAAWTKYGRMVDVYDSENDWIKDEWAYKQAEKYWRISHYPWLPVDPDPPPPKLLVHARAAVDLPAEMHWAGRYRYPDAPWWTFLWTWRRE